MPLYCPVDGQPGQFVRYEAPPKGQPYDTKRDRCQRPECGQASWGHWTVRL